MVHLQVAGSRSGSRQLGLEFENAWRNPWTPLVRGGASASLASLAPWASGGRRSREIRLFPSMLANMHAVDVVVEVAVIELANVDAGAGASVMAIAIDADADAGAWTVKRRRLSFNDCLNC